MGPQTLSGILMLWAIGLILGFALPHAPLGSTIAIASLPFLMVSLYIGDHLARIANFLTKITDFEEGEATVPADEDTEEKIHGNS